MKNLRIFNSLFLITLIFAGSSVLFSQDYYEREMLSLINDSRKEHGLYLLEYSSEMALIALDHSSDMMENYFVSHNSSDKRTTGDRILECTSLFILAYGENVARDESIESAHRELMLSDGHRKNILSADYTHVGIGIKKSSDGLFYITEKFIRLPVITEFSKMKALILSNQFIKLSLEYEAELEAIARTMVMEFIKKGSPPKIPSIPGYRKISQMSYKGSDIEETLDDVLKEARQYHRFGFFGQFNKNPGELAGLYCIFIFANQ